MLPQVKILGFSAFIALAWGLAPAGVDIAPHPARNSVADSAHSYLALGDSYTIGESVPVEDRYPVQASRLMRKSHFLCMDPEIIATTGWTTGNLLEGLYRKTPLLPSYDIVTILIGVNNQYQGGSQAEYRRQFADLVRQSIRLAGNHPSHVLVLSIPDYSVTPFAQGGNTVFIASQIDSFNTINFQVSTDYKVNWLDITGESRKAANDPSLIASDGLHFSGKEYGIWADKMEPFMERMLK
jgi:lysophospholipase L1-like esterase